MNQPARSTEERLVSLLLTLHNTTTGLSAEELVTSVLGYGLAGPPTNPLSARRKFERDKDTLREPGVEVTTTGRPEEPRYRIIEEDYTLPAPHPSAEWAACLSLAASTWRDDNLPATARRALTKLRAVSERPTGSGSAGLPVLTADLSGDEILEELITAVDECRLVTFDYVSARLGSTRARTIELHHLRLAEDTWYLDAVEPTGTHHPDASRQPEEAEGTAVGLRTFRLARIAGSITVHGSSGVFTQLPTKEPSRRRAPLAALPGRALGLRLAGAHLDPVQTPQAELPALPVHLKGHDLIAVEYEDPFSFTGTMTALDDAVVVLVPDSLHQAVLSHLQGAAGLTVPEGGWRRLAHRPSTSSRGRWPCLPGLWSTPA